MEHKGRKRAVFFLLATLGREKQGDYDGKGRGFCCESFIFR
jgi:hypothetical protein